MNKQLILNLSNREEVFYVNSCCAATLNAEKISLAYARIIYYLMKLLTPLIYIVDRLSVGIMILLHVDPNKKKDQITESELKTYVDVSHEDGVIESEEKEMIYNVFDLGDVKAKEVMVPRVHVAFADVNSSYRELIEIFKEYKFTRLQIGRASCRERV